jgi:RNA polymerase-binding transcription factor DksA
MPTKKKPVAKKAVKPVKPAAKKAAVKPVAKKPAKPAPKKAAPKPAAKKPAKPAPKPAAKKVVATPVVKKTVKQVPKPTPKPVAVAQKPVVKKSAAPAPDPKTAVVKKPEPVKATPAVQETTIKAPVKKAIQDLKKEAKAKLADIKPVKTTVNTSIKYQPDFTKSVLDRKPEIKEEGSIVRYSDAELQEFKDLIQRKLEAAKKELVFLQGLITRKDDSGGDDGDGRYMTMEDGSVSMEREQLNQRASRQITYINHLEKALMRIENKTYGICRVTGKLIDKARLRAVPHATLSMEAKTGQVKTSGE